MFVAIKQGFLGQLHFLKDLTCLDKKSVTADLSDYLSLTIDVCSPFEAICVLSHHIDSLRDAIRRSQRYVEVGDEDSDEAKEDNDDNG